MQESIAGNDGSYWAGMIALADVVDDRLRLPDNVYVVDSTTGGGSDVTNTETGEALSAGTYVALDGMPGGIDVGDIDGDGKSENLFDMGSTKGTIATGFYQQATDTIAQIGTGSVESKNKITTKFTRAMGG